MSNRVTINFAVEAQTADETDRLINETIRAYFGERMNQAMMEPTITQETNEFTQRKTNGDIFYRVFRTDVTATFEFLGYR